MKAIRGRAVAALAATVAMAGTVGAAAGLGATAASADTFRSAAGHYEGFLEGLSGPVEEFGLVLKANGVASAGIEGSTLVGTWSQPRLNGTLVIRFAAGGQVLGFTGHKTSAGISTPNVPGNVTLDGQTLALWYAVLQTP
jgi:hypothetical protein